MIDGDDYTPTLEEIAGAAASWFAEYGLYGVDLSTADIGAMVQRGLKPTDQDQVNGSES